MDSYKFVSENTIEHLSLHDCQCSRLYYMDSTLVFEMEWMEVLSTHPDNPFDNAYQSTKGKIILKNPIVELGKLITDDIQDDKMLLDIEKINIYDFEMLDFNEKISRNDRFLTLFGILDEHPKYEFIQMKIKYSSSKVMFNELTAVSWFEDNRFDCRNK